jgi:hypothetical protein
MPQNSPSGEEYLEETISFVEADISHTGEIKTHLYFEMEESPRCRDDDVGISGHGRELCNLSAPSPSQDIAVYARSSRLSPPTSRIVLKSVPRPNSLTTFSVCKASSREGDMMMPLAPTLAECCLSFSIMGMTKAAVLPDPVRAMPTTSSPWRSSGTALRWIGVGTLKPYTL